MLENFRPDKTLSAINIVVSDFVKLRKITAILFPLVMIAYYVYSVIVNANDVPMLVIKSVMLGLLVADFVVYMTFTYSKYRDKLLNKKISRIFKYLKHVVKIIATAFATYVMLAYDASVFQTIFTVIAIGGVVIQIAVDVITATVERYAKLIINGVMMDIEEFKNAIPVKAFTKTVDVFKNPTANFLELIDKPLSALANKKIATSPTEQLPEEEVVATVLSGRERKITERSALLVEKKKLKKERKKLEKAEKKATEKAENKERIGVATNSLKEHFSTAFSKKTKE